MDDLNLHRPVLFEEAIEAMNIQPDSCCMDGTFGRGGHSGAILERLGEQGCLIALDKDESAIDYGRKKFPGESRLHLVHSSFAALKGVAEEFSMVGKVHGVLLDLGVSSPQLDEPARGFSFQQEGPLDMRMDRSSGMSAAQWLATAEEKEIARVLWEFGEERFSRRIARAIVEQRSTEPLHSTLQLANLIRQASPVKERHKHPATRSFQAIRIHVNRELDDLREGLRQAVEVLATGGRLVVISFHSLEDRIVKRFMREQSRGDVIPRGVPVLQKDLKPGMLKLVGKAVRAGKRELEENPRARSAIMRVAEKRA
ncbi:16S rRNA (cytosine(1402)-N(4))-methyltransferase RsmH [Thiolapillus brandeum]|uniref:Ribosomal RNA small subunit methyltransferase H n=1 Tax=Thiolapillus brandeum TaxID=1076588 RepID=A0A7U6JHS1_9GAMM|nr:16S rRNA (cytosine(1402)-N(4))-methyltransferase RsmH [Thiolapillus brandeum]BAO43495.1 S-adenosyl-methyltransferase MraW [Thiolapillus brandeum]